MPAAVRYIEPNSKLRDTASNVAIATETQERKAAYVKSRKYYDGDHKRFLNSKAGEPDDNVVVNVTRMAIDRTASFLFPQMPTLELVPQETAETEEEMWLRQAWEYNGGVIFLQDVLLNGALSGHCYVRVIPPEEEGAFPRLVNLDPSQVVTYWKADDIDRVLWHEIRWSVLENADTNVETEYLQDVIYNEESKTWSIKQYRRENGTQWTEDFPNWQEWRYRYGPIVDWKHLPNPNRFYGKPETDHLDLNDKLNLIVSENARINRYHSSPKTVATGVKPNEISETDIDDLWATENEKANIYNLEMKSNQQFSQGLAVFMYDNYLAESRVVLLRGEVKDFQRVTNAGVRTVFMDMLSKNTILRRLYAVGIQKISRVMGAISGYGDQIIPDVVYPDPLPVDESEVIANYAIERSMGVVSRETISERRGYTWEDEKARMEAEAQLEMFKAPDTAPTPQNSAQSDQNA